MKLSRISNTIKKLLLLLVISVAYADTSLEQLKKEYKYLKAIEKFLYMPRQSALDSEEFKLLVAEYNKEYLLKPKTVLTLKMLMEYELDDRENFEEKLEKINSEILDKISK